MKLECAAEARPRPSAVMGDEGLCPRIRPMPSSRRARGCLKMAEQHNTPAQISGIARDRLTRDEHQPDARYDAVQQFAPLGLSAIAFERFPADLPCGIQFSFDVAGAAILEGVEDAASRVRAFVR